MSDEKNKNGFDEQTLARVLEAAYVLQEHQDELEELKSSLDLKRKPSNTASATASQAPSPTAPSTASPIASPPPASSPLSAPEAAAAHDYGAILAQVMETQNQVQARQLWPDAAMSLLAYRPIQTC